MANTEYRPKSSMVSQKRQDSIPSVWRIMRSHVNDNTPGYLYWFSRILAVSIVCLCLIEVVQYLF